LVGLFFGKGMRSKGMAGGRGGTGVEPRNTLNTRKSDQRWRWGFEGLLGERVRLFLAMEWIGRGMD
jgi:hypothetical protein